MAQLVKAEIMYTSAFRPLGERGEERRLIPFHNLSWLELVGRKLTKNQVRHHKSKVSTFSEEGRLT